LNDRGGRGITPPEFFGLDRGIAPDVTLAARRSRSPT
jgi:hypothetical protein